MRRKYLLLSVVALTLILAGCQTEPVRLIAYIEGRIPPDEDWFHWGVLGTDLPTLHLELRGTESKKRSNVEIVRFEWIFGDGVTALGEHTGHVYHTGYWYITLTVYDRQGNSASETLEIEVRGL